MLLFFIEFYVQGERSRKSGDNSLRSYRSLRNYRNLHTYGICITLFSMNNALELQETNIPKL